MFNCSEILMVRKAWANILAVWASHRIGSADYKRKAPPGEKTGNLFWELIWINHQLRRIESTLARLHLSQSFTSPTVSSCHKFKTRLLRNSWIGFCLSYFHRGHSFLITILLIHVYDTTSKEKSIYVHSYIFLYLLGHLFLVNIFPFLT